MFLRARLTAAAMRPHALEPSYGESVEAGKRRNHNGKVGDWEPRGDGDFR